MKKLSLMLLAALLAAFALAACGGDDDSEDEDQITEAIEFAATSGDPAACTEVQTQRFTEQITGGPTGEQAVRQCERDAEDTPADEVDVSNIEIDGDSANAEVAVTGSFLDGQTLDIGLVKEDDQWKLDDFAGFAEFDREAANASFAEEAAADPETPASARDCLIERYEALSDEEAQAFFTNEDEEIGDRVFGPCFGEEEGGSGGAEEGSTETEGAAETQESTDTQGSAGSQGSAGGTGGSQGGSGY